MSCSWYAIAWLTSRSACRRSSTSGTWCCAVAVGLCMDKALLEFRADNSWWWYAIAAFTAC